MEIKHALFPSYNMKRSRLPWRPCKYCLHWIASHLEFGLTRAILLPFKQVTSDKHLICNIGSCEQPSNSLHQNNQIRQIESCERIIDKGRMFRMSTDLKPIESCHGRCMLRGLFIYICRYEFFVRLLFWPIIF